MLTKNFYAFFACAMGGDNRKIFKNTSGREIATNVDLIASSNCIVFGALNHASNSKSAGVVFSTSTSKPNVNEFVPVNSIPSFNLNVSTGSTVTPTVTDSYLEYASTLAVSVPEGNSTTVTINSVFFVADCCDINGNSSPVLFDHTLLETPITLQPGESKQITYTIRFNYPQPPAV